MPAPDQVDFVLVYKESNNCSLENYFNRVNFLHNCQMNGLKLYIEKTATNDGDTLVYVLVTTPLQLFFQIAEKMKINLPITYNYYKSENNSFLTRLFNPSYLWSSPPDDNRPKFFTIPYDTALHSKFLEFFEEFEEHEIILDKDRFMVTYEILSRTTFSRKLTQPEVLQSNRQTNYSSVGIRSLLTNGSFQEAYPIHSDSTDSKSDRAFLWRNWASPRHNFFKAQPLTTIRLYFGEETAFYFAWLGFFTTWLIVPSLFGFLVIIYGLFTMSNDSAIRDICMVNTTTEILMCPLCNFPYCKPWKLGDSCTYTKLTYLVDNKATVVFALFMAVWSAFFIEFWKREQTKLQFEWDTANLGQKTFKDNRPEFDLKAKQTRINPVTEEAEAFITQKEKAKLYAVSVSVTTFMVCLVLAFVLGMIVYRVSLLVVISNSESLRQYSNSIVPITAAILNLVFIILLSNFYGWLAIKLTDMETHRTDENYQNSLTVKMYLFQFVNFYASIFYIAFIKGRYRFFFSYAEPCEPSGCLTELIITIFVTMLGEILYNFVEVLQPIFTNYLNRKRNLKSKSKSESENFLPKSHEPQWSQDMNLNKLSNLSLFDEYLEIVIQFGFITMFISAFPLAPLIALLANLFEIRIDAFKALTQMRRPLPKRAKDIGIWLAILDVLSKGGIVINSAIIAFTSEVVPRMVYAFRHGQGSLEGYVNNTLITKSVSRLEDSIERRYLISLNINECRHRGFSEQFNWSHELTNTDYEVFVARLVFMFIFEHIAFFLVAVINACVKSVPTSVREQIDKEARIREDILWEAKPLNGRNQDELEESTAHLLQMLDIPSVHSSQILQTTTRI